MNRRTFDKLRRIYVERAMVEIDNAMANSFLPPPPVIPCRVSTGMLVDAVRVGSERSDASRAVQFILKLIARASSIPFAKLDKASREK